MVMRSVVIGTGSYLPEKVVTNDDLAKIVDTSDEWITQRTGIKSRHFAADDEFTSHMATKAAQKAIEAAKINNSDIDCIIVATTTPDTTFPSTAVHVQNALGRSDGVAFDIQAVCSGFVYALSTADNFIKAGQAKCALVIGAEKLTNILNWEDRTTCVLFADGAGAVILKSEELQDDDKAQRGILSTHLHANGQLNSILGTDGGVGSTASAGAITMQGKDVFKHAVTLLSQVVEETLAHNKIEPADIDYLVPHQANIRIIEGAAKKLSLPMDKVVVTVHKHGNTSAASIPLALDESVRDGRIKPGHLVLTEALGGGLTWGAALIRF